MGQAELSQVLGRVQQGAGGDGGPGGPAAGQVAWANCRISRQSH